MRVCGPGHFLCPGLCLVLAVGVVGMLRKLLGDVFCLRLVPWAASPEAKQPPKRLFRSLGALEPLPRRQKPGRGTSLLHRRVEALCCSKAHTSSLCSVMCLRALHVVFHRYPLQPPRARRRRPSTLRPRALLVNIQLVGAACVAAGTRMLLVGAPMPHATPPLSGLNWESWSCGFLAALVFIWRRELLGEVARTPRGPPEHKERARRAVPFPNAHVIRPLPRAFGKGGAHRPQPP